MRIRILQKATIIYLVYIASCYYIVILVSVGRWHHHTLPLRVVHAHLIFILLL